MNIETKQIGSYGGRPATAIEVTINLFDQSVTEDVTDRDGKVNENLIIELRELADELEEQNRLVIESLLEQKTKILNRFTPKYLVNKETNTATTILNEKEVEMLDKIDLLVKHRTEKYKPRLHQKI